MSNIAPVTPGPVQAAHNEAPPKTGTEKTRPPAAPPTGTKDDHAIYRGGTPAWAKEAGSRIKDAALPYHEAAKGEHINLLANLSDREKFAGSLIKLGAVAVKCALKKALTKGEHDAAYNDCETASRLNDQCAEKLKAEGPGAEDKVVEIGKSIYKTAKLVNAVYEAVQRNRASFGSRET